MVLYYDLTIYIPIYILELWIIDLIFIYFIFHFSFYLFLVFSFTFFILDLSEKYDVILQIT